MSRAAPLRLSATVLLFFALLLAACGAPSSSPPAAPTSAPVEPTSAPAAPTSAPAAEAPTTAPAAAEPVRIRFYGQIDEDASTPDMMAALQKHFTGEYEIEPIKVVWDNLDTVIKTAIVSDDPADIYFYWPQGMRSFVEAGEALDLTPYLEANGGEWKNTFIQSSLDLGKYDGKYYNVPIIQQSTAFFVNQSLADQLGVTIPDRMSWDEFLSVSAQIKAKDPTVFPFGIQAGWQGWIPRNGLLSLANDADKLDAMAAGEVPATDPIFVQALENSGKLFQEGYIYPGEGALTATGDEVMAAFTQGKIVMMAGVFSVAKDMAAAAETGGFELRTVAWPAMGSESLTVGGCNGFFIPANAKNPDAAVEVLKYYLGSEVQTINAQYGLATANAQVKIDDPVLSSILTLADGIHPQEFYTYDTTISQFFDKNFLADYVLGGSTESILGKLEELRVAALKE